MSRKGFNKSDGTYMCKCICGKIFYSDNKREVVCTDCDTGLSVKFIIQRIGKDLKWEDTSISSKDPKIILEKYKYVENYKRFNHRIIKETREAVREEDLK